MSTAMKGEKIELQYTEKIGRRMLAITKCQMNPHSHFYEWTFTNEKKRKDRSQRIIFLYSSCRSLRDGKKVAKDTPLPSLIASLIIREMDKEICWAGEGNGASHCCAGPKEKVQIIARAIKRSLGAELAVGSTETATSAVTRLKGKILTKMTDVDEESLLKARRAALLENTEALAQFFRRCTCKRFPKVKRLKELKMMKKLHWTHRGATAKKTQSISKRDSCSTLVLICLLF